MLEANSIKRELDFLARKPVVEADLTQEEIKFIEKGYKEYKTSPENFISLETAFS